MKPTDKKNQESKREAGDDIDDPLIINRRIPILPASQVPPVDKAFRRPDAAVKRGMRKVVESQRSEVRDALVEIAAKEAALAEDLGPKYAPRPGRAAELVGRMDAVRAGKLAAEKLTTYYNEMEDLIHHDAMTLVGDTKDEILHAARRDPHVTDNYPKLIALVEQRRDAILDGRARARAAAGGEDTIGNDDGTPSPK